MAPGRICFLCTRGGKARVHTVVTALRALDVPVRVVVDFDALNDEQVLRRIYEGLGGDWEVIRGDWNIVRAAIESQRPQLSTQRVREQVSSVLERVTTTALAKSDIERIRGILKGASAWSEAKRMGKAFVPSGDPSVAYSRLVNKLQAAGIYLVEVGELEQFCKTAGSHGPAWTVAVLERDLAGDPELEEGRRFAKLLLSGWNQDALIDD
jgi:hypothetical protein